jgi:hypothetical protein
VEGDVPARLLEPPSAGEGFNLDARQSRSHDVRLRKKVVVMLVKEIREFTTSTAPTMTSPSATRSTTVAAPQNESGGPGTSPRPAAPSARSSAVGSASTQVARTRAPETIRKERGTLMGDSWITGDPSGRAVRVP